MKSNYTGIWLLLTCALAIMIFVSFSDDISVGGWTVKKAPFAETIYPCKFTDTELNGYRTVTQDSIKDSLKEFKVVETDSMPKSIFMFGDSMTYNLARRLAKYAKQNGHELHAVNWDSSNTKIWAESDTLAYFLNKYNPDYIFISLGSNEVYFKDPTKRMPYVKKILSLIGDIPYVWIGPPNWNEETKINDMLEATCAPGSFFRSQGMKFVRQQDHIHPTRASSEQWMDSIMRWLPKSAHPILAVTPSDSIKKVQNKVVFLKALNR
ncbi:SGNH/GDSL hydrolase family protein [Lepagella muris]|uniref:SGNH/GDSL hydrolase family protein n=1 Tax=Lepagella muris TaxID=3032870 RepID=A0AC61RCJ9_9BACT|nr:SGNH/GDSL hydrolase family protein [Lepagella muris]TGY77185.1 SGNH/GDSL hydrolase family protein [Lepagella muris]THG49092.1 hypothetical protein E5984_14875 [Bacteroidales bacterium]TKC54236.1 hypothetical protein E5359_019150 [Bacteroidales bacterium]